MQINERVLGRLLEYERRGLTVKEIAYMTGFSLQYVANTLNRHHAVPKQLKPMEVLAVLAYHLHGFDKNEVAEWLDIHPSSAWRLIISGTEKLRNRRLEAGL